MQMDDAFASLNHISVITVGDSSIASTAAVNPCVGRWQYLVIYSQAFESTFFTQETFKKMLEAEFMQASALLMWTIGCIPGRSTRMKTFTIIVRWSCKKWLSVKNRIAESPGI